MPKLVKVSFVLFVEDQNKLIAARSFNKAKRKQISLTIEKNNQATGKKKSYMFTCKFLSKQLGSKCFEHMQKLLSFGSILYI